MVYDFELFEVWLKKTYFGSNATEPKLHIIKPSNLFIMKQTCLSIAALIFFSTLSFSQTTMEEYNYISKGYKIQLESGLDMKRGYKIIDIETFKVEHSSWHRAITFKVLVREEPESPAAIIMIVERSDSNYKAYYCIPLYDSDETVWKQAYDNYKNILTSDWISSSSYRDYSWGMIKMISLAFSIASSEGQE